MESYTLMAPDGRMKKPHRSALQNWATLSLFIGLSACGGGGGQTPPPVTVSTLAYVVTECRQDATGVGTIRPAAAVHPG